VDSKITTMAKVVVQEVLVVEVAVEWIALKPLLLTWPLGLRLPSGFRLAGPGNTMAPAAANCHGLQLVRLGRASWLQVGLKRQVIQPDRCSPQLLLARLLLATSPAAASPSPILRLAVAAAAAA
jgi:hypothetical protein